MAVRDRVHSVGDVFFAIAHDNNHITNSLWIYLLGLDVDWRWYRLPAVLAGSLTVLVMRRLLLSAGSVAPWLVTVLCVPSFLLINYASEARGYGVMMLCAVASLWLLEVHERACDDAHRERRRLALAGFWGAAMLGTLAHASYGATLVALALWMLVRVLRAGRESSARIQRFALLFGPPLALAVWLWVVNFLHVTRRWAADERLAGGGGGVLAGAGWALRGYLGVATGSARASGLGYRNRAARTRRRRACDIVAGDAAGTGAAARDGSA